MKVFVGWSGDSRDVITLVISRTSKAAAHSLPQDRRARISIS
jgi:hypothetical protein